VTVSIEIDGQPTNADEGTTVLEALRRAGMNAPTLCYHQNLTPVNACRVCMVELEGSRTLVPSC
jgi:NADP-reducing hydrogenase subunit HndD